MVPRTDSRPSRVIRLARSRRCQILDDRDQMVELLNPFRMYLSGREDLIERPVLKSILDTGTEGGSRKLRLSVLFAGVLLVAMGLFAFVPEYRASNDLRHALSQAVRSPVLYFALGYGLLIVPWQLQGERRIYRRQITRALLERHRCAHCGYNLQGLKPDPDTHATVCPECDCAWKLDEASVANRGGDDQQARRETVRFGIVVGIVMTVIGLGMGLFYLL